MQIRPLIRAFVTDLEVSWRNVFRQGRRSLAAALAVIFGTAALIVAAGFIERIFFDMREGTIHAGLGHLQVVRAGYLERGVADPFAYLLDEAAPERKLVESTAHVRALAPRLRFSGLVGFAGSTFSFLGEGRDPEREVGGHDALIIEAGAPLSHARREHVVLGQGLAANLGVKVGDSVVLLVNRRGGAFGGMEATVGGIFSTQAKAYDDVALQMTFSLANELLQAQGAHAWVLYLDETGNTPAVAGALKAALGPQLAVVPWYETADFYHKTVELFSRQVLVMKLIIGLVVILSVSNTMLMMVMERTSEIATAMALGVRRARVLSRFLIEGLLIGLAGGLAGVVLGLALSELISQIGIPMPPPPGMGRGFLAQILVTPALVREAVVIAAGTALAASVYPAWKGSRMVIAEALRHGR